jgi:CheY-like chemotaxis protein
MTDMPGKGDSSPKRILWVDDEPDAAFYHRKYLEHVCAGGFEVTQALDVAQALDYLMKQRWDMVILDLILPMQAGAPVRTAPGLDLLRWIRNESPDPGVPVIAVSAYRKQHVQEELEALGAALLSKPVDPHRLVECLQQATRPES